jgi:hypothetical protein
MLSSLGYPKSEHIMFQRHKAPTPGLTDIPARPADAGDASDAKRSACRSIAHRLRRGKAQEAIPVLGQGTVSFNSIEA